jgi:hypothetical protein
VHIEGLQRGDYFEAPWLFKLNGVYYLSFMESYGFGASIGAPFGWSLGYATRTEADPLGNYTYRGPLLWANPRNCDKAEKCSDALGSVGGNSHHGFVLDWPKGSGQHWLAYHTRGLAVDKHMVTFSQRNVAFDRAYIANDSTVLVTATPNWVVQQRSVDAYETQPASMMAAGSSLFLATQDARTADPDGGMWRYLSNITRDSHLRIRGVDFGAAPGAQALTVRAAALAPGARIEARLGTVDGALVASVLVSGNGGWSAWSNYTARVTASAVGVSDLFLVFRAPPGLTNASAPFLALASWAFSGATASGAPLPPPPPRRVALLARATGLYVTAPADGSTPMSAGASAPAADGVFTIIDNGDGSFALLAAANGRYVAALTPGGMLAAAVTDRATPLARWRLYGTPDTGYAIAQADVPATIWFVTAGPLPSSPLRANATVSDVRQGIALFNFTELV